MKKQTIPVTTPAITKRAQISAIRALAKSLIPRHVVAHRVLETLHGSMRRADARKAFDKARERAAIHSQSCSLHGCDAALLLAMALDSALDGRASQAYSELDGAAINLKWVASQEFAK